MLQGRLTETEIEIKELKKISDKANRGIAERENLILENAKQESEIKRLSFDLEEAQNVLERQGILLKNKDSQIVAMTEEIGYLTFNSKKLKSDGDRLLQDAIAYQQITRKMEKELADYQIKKETAEQELLFVKQQLYKK